MRIHVRFEGPSSHAVQLLGRIVPESVGDEIAAVIEAIRFRLPEMGFCKFYGSVTLPRKLSLPKGKSKPQLLEIRIITEERAAMLIPSLGNTSKSLERAICDWIFAGDLILKKDEHNFILNPESKLRPLKEFVLGEVEFAERKGMLDGEKGTSVTIEVRYDAPNGFNCINVRVREKVWHGRAYGFAQDLAGIVRQTDVSYYTPTHSKFQEGGELIYWGYDWNRGQPRAVTEGERRERARLDAEIEPYKDFIDPYLQAIGYERSNQGGVIYHYLGQVLTKGVGHPTLGLILSIALYADRSHPRAYDDISGSLSVTEEPLSKAIPDDVLQGIGIAQELKIGYPKNPRDRKRHLPSDAMIRMVVLDLFRYWRSPAQLKRINDEFMKRYPLRIFLGEFIP